MSTTGTQLPEGTLPPHPSTTEGIAILNGIHTVRFVAIVTTHCVYRHMVNFMTYNKLLVVKTSNRPICFITTAYPHSTIGYTSVSMSEVPEGYVPTTAGNMEHHSITTWRSDSQYVMISASQTLAAIETAALPPTLQTTVAMSSHNIPTGSVLPTLGLQHNHAGKETYMYQSDACQKQLKSCKHGSNM